MSETRVMRRVIKVSLMFAAMLAGAAGAYGYLSREEPEKVTVIKPVRLTIEETVTATGTVDAARTILVTLDPGSRIVSTHFKEQDHVRQGQLLAKLDETELAAQLSQHRANLKLAETNLAGAEVNVQRFRRLYEKGFAARQEVENAERQVELYRAQIADRKAGISQIEARLARTRIVAPIDAVVTRKLAEEGAVVADANPRVPGQGLQPTAIAELAEVGSTEFRADVDQADITKLRVGQAATLEIDAFPRRVFEAVIRGIAVASTPDVAGRVRYTVRLAVSAGEGLLKVGMSGSAKFVIAKKSQALALPITVVLQQSDDESVYVLEDGRAILRKIKTGLQGEDMVEVVSGLNPEDLVIDQGRAKLKNGRRVELMDAKR